MNRLRLLLTHSAALASAMAGFSAFASGSVPPEALPAFPGAEGYGRFAKGGRGGDVYHVTNLDDDGAGSLREAIRTKKPNVPRTVVFDVAGTIKLKKPLIIDRVSGLTLAGQTAPGGGIAIRDHGVCFHRCSDVVVRYLRFRLGDVSKSSEDVLAVGREGRGCRDIIFDHLSAICGCRHWVEPPGAGSDLARSCECEGGSQTDGRSETRTR